MNQGSSEQKVATLMGLEPTTSAVTGRRSNQLSYNAKAVTRTLARRSRRLQAPDGSPGVVLSLRARQTMVGTVGIEPTTPRV